MCCTLATRSTIHVLYYVLYRLYDIPYMLYYVLLKQRSRGKDLDIGRGVWRRVPVLPLELPGSSVRPLAFTTMGYSLAYLVYSI